MCFLKNSAKLLYNIADITDAFFETRSLELPICSAAISHNRYNLTEAQLNIPSWPDFLEAAVSNSLPSTWGFHHTWPLDKIPAYFMKMLVFWFILNNLNLAPEPLSPLHMTLN